MAGSYLGLAANPANAVAGMMGGGGMGGGGMGGGVTVINPPVGSAFKDPVIMPNISAVQGVVEVNLEAKMTRVSVNGTMANLMTYNGSFPGPTVRAKKSDLLRVNFKNSLPADGATNMLGHQKYITNLHTHGLHVSPGDNANGTHSDNMLVQIAPGNSEVYEYDLSMQESGTLNFYHPHIHGSVSDQMWAGLAGALVVEDAVSVLSNFETHLLMLQDISLAGSEPSPHSTMMDYMHGKEGNTVMVNGQVNPLLTVRPGQVQRWRIVNSSVARFYKLSLENHAMYLVGTEGGLLDKPYQVTELLLSPGERVDVLVKANQPSRSYKFLSLAYDRGMNSLQTVTLMTVSYKGSGVNDAIPSAINPDAKRLSIDTASLPVQSFVLSMGQGHGYINGRTFIDHTTCDKAMSTVGTYEVWEVINQSGMDHPFHHHVNPAQVLSITGGDAKYSSLYTSIPAWKDVTIVPKFGKIRLLMPVMDYTGMAMYHCHIIEHEDIGMMGMWHLMGEMM